MTSKNNFHNIGLIGAGEFGHFATSVIDRLPNFKLVAVADLNEKSALDLAKKYKAKVYADFNDLLEDQNVEIVMINTPNFLHAKMVIASLKANKKVLCEKPMFINNAEKLQVEKTLKQTEGILLVNYLLPHAQYYQKIKSFIKEGKYGKIKYIRIENFATESTIPDGWYWNKKKSGGWFLTADIHFYDLINFILNDSAKVVSAKEFKKNGKTTGIFTSLKSKEVPICIYHDFESGYDRVGFEAKFVFEKAEVTISGWVPMEMIIKDKKTKKYTQNFNREEYYQKLVAENFRKLADLNYRESQNNFQRVADSSEIALTAQVLSERKK